MKEFITGTKCRMQRAVSESLGHKANRKKLQARFSPREWYLTCTLEVSRKVKVEVDSPHIRGEYCAKKVKIICGFSLVSQAQCPRCKTLRSKCSQ